MHTSTITSNIVVGGIQMSSTISREAEGQISHSTTLAAGVAGAIDASDYVDGLATGHGFEASDVVDIHWTDPSDGTAKSRRGVTIDTANANSIEFDNDPAAEGDALPDEDTAVVVSLRTTIDTDWDADDAEIVAAMSTKAAVVDFRAAAASIDTVDLTADSAWFWVNGLSTNPLTGDPVSSIVASNATTTAATLKVGVLYQSV